MAHPKVLAFVLAGGKGERLFPLTAFRCGFSEHKSHTAA
jgi:ADP-glucose pyrophosphorylase